MAWQRAARRAPRWGLGVVGRTGSEGWDRKGRQGGAIFASWADDWARLCLRHFRQRAQGRGSRLDRRWALVPRWWAPARRSWALPLRASAEWCRAGGDGIKIRFVAVRRGTGEAVPPTAVPVALPDTMSWSPVGKITASGIASTRRTSAAIRIRLSRVQLVSSATWRSFWLVLVRVQK